MWCFQKAQSVFNNLSTKSINVWNAWLLSCVDHGHDDHALQCFEQMKAQAICPSTHTFVICLRACVGIGGIEKGKCLHAALDTIGKFEENIFTGSVLVNMYGKFGLLAEAQQVFDNILHPNVVTWTSLIREYAQHGFDTKALLCFEKMQVANVIPNDRTFASVLTACGNERAVNKGLEIHAEVSRRGLSTNRHIGTALVNFYSKCGFLTRVCEVMDGMTSQDTASWNSLIAAYVEHGHAEEALKCFDQMQGKGIGPSDVTYINIVPACGIIGAASRGIELHANIERQGALWRNPQLGCSLIVMYGRFFLLSKAQDVFDKLPSPDLASWNALIFVHTEKSNSEKALECLEQMQARGVCPDAVTFIGILKACGRLHAAKKTQEILAEVKTQKLLLINSQLGNILVHTLAKCKLFTLAQQVFDALPVRDVVAWTGLVSGYVEHGHHEAAFRCFEQMQLEGVAPNAHTYASTLKACGSIGSTVEVQEILCDIERQGLLEDNLAAGMALIALYARVSWFSAAKQAFESLQVHDVVSWTALMASLSVSGQPKDAIVCFEQMQSEGLSPDALTLVSCLRACGNIGALDKGHEIHSEIERRGLVMTDQVIGNSVVAMYAKCGSLTDMQKVFDNLSSRNEVAWTALMVGYAQLGCGERAYATWNLMFRDGKKPDPVTFLVLLSACGRTGLVSKIQTCYEAMSQEHGILPVLEHQTLIVDSIGKTGQVGRIVTYMKQMPLNDSLPRCLAVLGVCQRIGNTDLGAHVFELAMQTSISAVE